MSASLIVRGAGPAMTIQDLGRPGQLARGLSRGGAVDRLALAEGAALLGQEADLAAVEMGGMGGVFEATADLKVALSGSPMEVKIGDAPVQWHASHSLPRGAKLHIGAARGGGYGYLHVGGGIDAPMVMGARSAHLTAGIGTKIADGDHLPIGPDGARGQTGYKLDVEDRFHGGTVRIVPSLQTGFFSAAEQARFEDTTFTRDARGNRMGVRCNPDGDGFQSDAGLSVLSEVITPGDVQITGDGTPFVLLAECQTTGGYPRIGAVIPADLPRVAQSGPGAKLHFRFIDLEEAIEIERKEAARIAGLENACTRILRDPADIPDLLSYQLIGGVTAGRDREGDDT